MDERKSFNTEVRQGVVDFLKVLAGEMTMEEFQERNPGAYVHGVVRLDSEGNIVEDISDRFVGSTTGLDELLNLNNIIRPEDQDDQEED